MRAITADLKVIVGRLGPLVGKALEGAIRRAVSAEHPEVTTDHLLRALLDLPDSDLCVAMANAHIERKDVVARLEWHLGRIHGKHEGKPRLSHALCLLLDDAGKLTTDRVRSGHVTTALLNDPSLSAADIGKLLDALPRLSLHLLASRVEDKGEIGRVLPPPAAEASSEAETARPAPVAFAPAAPKPARMRKSRRSEVRGAVPGIGCCAWMVESVLCMFDAPGEVGNWGRTRNREMKAGVEGAPSLDAPMLCPRVNRWRVRYAPSKAPGAATRAGPCPLCRAAPGRVHRLHRPQKSPDCPRARSS